MLRKAAALTDRHVQGAETKLSEDAKRAELSLIAAYQREIMRLREALRDRNKKQIRVSAGALREALAGCDEAVRRRLERLAAANREEVKQ